MIVRWITLFLVVYLYGCAEGGVGGTGGSGIVSTGDSAAATTTLNGSANKGPFEGAQITVYSIDELGGRESSIASFQSDSLGAYGSEVEDHPAFELVAEGIFFRESLGTTTDSTVQLRTIDNGDVISVNAATHIVAGRVQKLMSEGNDLDAAVQMATSELTLTLSDVLPVPDSPLTLSNLEIFNQTSTSTDPVGNAWLLTLSTLLDASSGDDPQTYLDALSSEFADAGALSTESIQQLIEVRASVNPDRVHTSLLQFAEPIVTQTLVANDAIAATTTATCSAQLQQLICTDSDSTEESVFLGDSTVAISTVLADMNAFLDTDGDGLVNADDTDDDNDGLPDADDAAPYSPAPTGQDF